MICIFLNYDVVLCTVLFFADCVRNRQLIESTETEAEEEMNAHKEVHTVTIHHSLQCD